MSTPPSNAQKANKFLGISTHNGIFSCTPREELQKTNKDENGKHTSMFS